MSLIFSWECEQSSNYLFKIILLLERNSQNFSSFCSVKLSIVTREKTHIMLENVAWKRQYFILIKKIIKSFQIIYNISKYTNQES